MFFIFQTNVKNGQYYFYCQHGEEECHANKIHACSIDALANMTMAVRFTECIIAMDEINADEALVQVNLYKVDLNALDLWPTYMKQTAPLFCNLYKCLFFFPDWLIATYSAVKLSIYTVTMTWLPHCLSVVPNQFLFIPVWHRMEGWHRKYQ